MSATVKTLSSFVFFSVAASQGVLAQEMNNNFFSGMTAQSPSDGQEGNSSVILSTIDEMIDNVSKMDPVTGEASSITIEEIDRRNREAQRLENDLSLREARFREMQMRVDMLLSLETARRKMAETAPAQTTPAPQPSQTTTTAGQPNGASQPAQPSDPEIAQEQMNVPHISRILGAGGEYKATIVSVTGVQQQVSTGDYLVNGFRVTAIDDKGAIITGLASGKNYFIAPSEPVQPKGNAETSGQAIDLGTTSFPGLF